jgi:hypothetical protein
MVQDLARFSALESSQGAAEEQRIRAVEEFPADRHHLGETVACAVLDCFCGESGLPFIAAAPLFSTASTQLACDCEEFKDSDDAV